MFFSDEELKLCAEEFEMIVNCLSDDEIMTDRYIDFCLVMKEYEDPHGCLPLSWQLRSILSAMKSMKRIAPQEFEELKVSQDSCLDILLSYYDYDEKQLIEYAMKHFKLSRRAKDRLENEKYAMLSADNEIVYRIKYLEDRPNDEKLRQDMVAYITEDFNGRYTVPFA